MFIKDNQPIDPNTWVPYSYDGSGNIATLVQTQPKEATPEQLVFMGISVVPDPLPVVPSVASVLPIISDRQFFQELAVMGVITQDEALAAVGPGTLPASLAALVAALPVDQQFPANMLLKGAVQFDRNHPMVSILGQAFGWNSDQLDALWIAAARL